MSAAWLTIARGPVGCWRAVLRGRQDQKGRAAAEDAVSIPSVATSRLCMCGLAGVGRSATLPIGMTHTRVECNWLVHMGMGHLVPGYPKVCWHQQYIWRDGFPAGQVVIQSFPPASVAVRLDQHRKDRAAERAAVSATRCLALNVPLAACCHPPAAAVCLPPCLLAHGGWQSVI